MRPLGTKIAWVLTAWGTNLGPVPWIFTRDVLLKPHLVFEVCLAVFTLGTSMMYHLCDSWQIYGSRGIWLGEGAWHRFDNIGAIMCFVVLLVHLCDYDRREVAECNKFVMLWITIAVQERAPWKAWAMIGPIAVQAIIFLCKRLLYDGCMPKWNRYHMRRSLAWQGVAFVFFFYALDERKDPLRLYHGLWHLFSGIASVHHWQLITSKREQETKLISERRADSRKRFGAATRA